MTHDKAYWLRYCSSRDFGFCQAQNTLAAAGFEVTEEEYFTDMKALSDEIAASLEVPGAFRNVMIDLETLGTGIDAHILSIGAVLFDPVSGLMGPEFSVKMTKRSQPFRRIDSDTVYWWMGQPQEARDRIFAPPAEGVNSTAVDLDVGLTRLVEFLKDHIPRRDDRVVWAWGVMFDIGILQDAMSRMAWEIPWSFRNVSCCRTLQNLLPGFQSPAKREGVMHDAVDDCKNQIRWVTTAIAALAKEHGPDGFPV